MKRENCVGFTVIVWELEAPGWVNTVHSEERVQSVVALSNRVACLCQWPALLQYTYSSFPGRCAAEHPNITDVYHAFTEKLKTMQTHITATGDYSKQALTHTHTHTTGTRKPRRENKPTYANSALPIWFGERGNKGHKNTHITTQAAKVFFSALSALDNEAVQRWAVLKTNPVLL